MCYLRELGIAPGTNQLPGLSNLNLQGEGPTALAEIDYADQDSNCPVVAEMVFDGSLSYPMYPTTLDYTSTVTYSTEAGIQSLADSSWTSAVLIFSDNISDSVTYQAPTVGIPTDPWPQGTHGLRARAAPNPSTGPAVIEFYMPRPGAILVDVYDARGVLVQTLLEREIVSGPGMAIWSRRDSMGAEVSPGIYFCKITALEHEEVVKLVLIR